VVLDGGNGTAGPAAVRLFEMLGCRVEPLYCEPDGTFPNHHPNPLVPANLEDLCRMVREKGADLGFAYDGDGDRMTLVDEKGQIRWTDRSLAVAARDLLAEDPGRAVVFDVKATQAVADVVNELGGRPVMVKTGYPFLLDGMAKEKAVVGAELSGHMYYADPVFDFDDGVYASARVAASLSALDGPVSAAYESLPNYTSSPEIRVHCPDERKFAVADELAAQFLKEYEVITIDGARVLFGDGWGLVRASNTEPDLVLVFEGRDAQVLSRIMKQFHEALSAFPEVDLTNLTEEV
jgi:phosphomannomutase/phosphoglucomutase